METRNPCCCCLLRPPDKDLNSPYVYLGLTDTFSDLLQECFQIQFTTGPDYECGICEECAARLRDARDFKMQVQRCQRELGGALNVKDEERLVKLELWDQSEDFKLQAPAKWEMSDDGVSERESSPCPVEPLSSSPRLVSELSRSQLAMACSVRLERLRDDKAPHARHTSPRTSPRQPSVTTHMRVQAEQQTDRTEPRHLTAAAAQHTYECDTCGELFARKYDIVTHLKKHDSSGQLCSKRISQSGNVIEHKHTHSHTGDKPYTCDVCNKKFTEKYSLTRHSRIHTGYKPFSCDMCSKKFSEKWYLKHHMSRIHTSDGAYSCEVCSKKFSKRWNLAQHKLIHTGDKPYTCEICHKKFKQKSHLNQHLTIHTGYKPYSCNVCSEKFTQKGSLKIHKQAHTGDKPYTCDICNKKFTRKTNLTQHITSHTGYKLYACDSCSEKFTRKNHLQVHKRIHTGDKHYTCDICNKQLAHKHNLARHIRIHTVNKQESCDVCSKKVYSKV